MRWLLIVLLAAMPEARGDWLSLCHGLPASALQAQDGGILAHYIHPDERISLLRLTRHPMDADCLQRNLAMTQENILWAGFAPKLTADMTTVGLQGQEQDGKFKPGEVILPEPASAAPAPDTIKPPTLNRWLRLKSPARSAWFWSPAAWLETPQRIFETKSRFKLGRILITVPVVDGEVDHAGELRAFLKRAHAEGLQVWAVLGDPRAVLSEGQDRFMTASAALGAFNSGASRMESLDGLQLDIEAYLLPGYWQNQAGWLSRYAATIASIHQAAPDVALDIVLPFWFNPETPEVASMLDEVAPSIARLTIMDYRTDPAQIKHFATTFLAWGRGHDKPVDIALETLAMAPEERRQYRQAESGEVWRLVMGNDTVLLLMNKPLPAGAEATGYRYSHTRQIDGTDISFFRNKGSLPTLLDTLENELKAWTSFSGLAIHGLDQW